MPKLPTEFGGVIRTLLESGLAPYRGMFENTSIAVEAHAYSSRNTIPNRVRRLKENEHPVTLTDILTIAENIDLPAISRQHTTEEGTPSIAQQYFQAAVHTLGWRNRGRLIRSDIHPMQEELLASAWQKGLLSSQERDAISEKLVHAHGLDEHETFSSRIGAARQSLEGGVSL